MRTARGAAAALTQALGGGGAAGLAAAALVEADAIGQPRFGLTLLDEWTPASRRLAPLTAGQPLHFVDATGCFSPLAVAEATCHLAAETGALGMAAVFLRGARGVGRLAPFLRHLADQGLVALAGAEGPPFVAPQGGNRPVIGTNPFAFAMGQGPEQVVIDLASSVVTMAEIKSARAEGRALPAGIAFDAAGQPTTRAADVAALLPRGGQFGSLIGLVVELLAGVAGGGRGDPQGRGTFLIAFDPAKGAVDTDWPEKLAGLQRDWCGAGGYWPGARRLDLDADLGPDFAARMAAHLQRFAP